MACKLVYQFSTMHTASYEFLTKPEESAECHVVWPQIGRLPVGQVTCVNGQIVVGWMKFPSFLTHILWQVSHNIS